MNVILYFMLELQDWFGLPQFLLLTSTAILPIAALGGIVGIACKTQTAASTAIAPILLFLLFLPIFVTDGFLADSVMSFFFTE